MARFRSGSPKNMRQGQYWVRRHLDDQKRAAAAERRMLAEQERAHRASARADAQRGKQIEKHEKEAALRLRRQAHAAHFEKVQSEIACILQRLTTATCPEEGRLAIDVEKDGELHKLLDENQTRFNELSSALSDGDTPLSASNLSKHIQNAKRMLVGVGKVSGMKTKWDAHQQILTVGELSVDFAAPEDPAFFETDAVKSVPQRTAPRVLGRTSSTASMMGDNVLEREQPPASSSGALWLIGSLVGVFAALFVISGFITGWEGVGHTLKATGALILILFIGIGFFGGRR